MGEGYFGEARGARVGARVKEIKAPALFKQFTVFLAGSIEMGTASDWRGELKEMLLDTDVLLLNPWRDDWDDSWEQSIKDQNFREQVEWELDGIDKADLVAIHFDSDTSAPITLLELGICTSLLIKCVVHCPDGFWRKGNVDIVCERFKIDQVGSLRELADYIRKATS